MTGHLTYRLFRDEDLPGLLRLWEEETSWGSLSPEKWHQLVMNTACGPSCIVVTVDRTGRIVGQFVFKPSLVCVNGREVRAFRAFAPIVNKAACGSLHSAGPLNHPIVAMYMHAKKTLQTQSGGLIYMVPDTRWLRFFRLFPDLHCGSFPLWSLPLPLAAPLPLGDGYTAGPLEVWDQRVDRLWNTASRMHGCLVVRDSRILPWKVSQVSFGGSDYNVTAVERDGEMVGLVASLKKGHQWLICDLLAADAEDSLRATLAAVCNLAQCKWVATDPEKTKFPLRKVAVLVTPVMEPVVRSLGFAREAYDIPIVVHILDSAIAEQDVAPDRWYISIND